MDESEGKVPSCLEIEIARGDEERGAAKTKTETHVPRLLRKRGDAKWSGAFL
jgi:hypothetical protein